MPKYNNLVIDANLSLSKLGQLTSARLQNVTTAGRLTLEGQLVASELLGNIHSGQVVFDINEGVLYVFNSATSKFERISYDIQGDIVYRGDINPTLAASSSGGNTVSGPIEAKKGNQYVADVAGDLVMPGVSFSPSNKVQPGDAVLFWDAATAYVFQTNTGPATTEQAGTIDISSQADVDAGVSDSDAVTPATLAGSILASEIALLGPAEAANAANILSLKGYAGLGTLLDTSAASIAEAINEIFSRADSASVEVDALETFTGEGTTLTTLATDIASAINEVKASRDIDSDRLDAIDTDVTNLQIFSGITTALDTTASDLAAAINELHGEVDTNASEIASNIADIASNTASVLYNEIETETNAIEIADLISRVELVDTTFINVDSDIEDLQRQITANDSDIASALTQIGNSGNDSDIASLEDRMSTAELNIVSNDSDIISLQARMLITEGDIVLNDSDIAANASKIASLQGYTGEGTPLDTTATSLSGAINELHNEINANVPQIASNDSDILDLQNFTGSGALDTVAQDLAGAINELQSEIEGNDSDFAVLNDIILGNESHAEIKAFNQDNIDLIADTPYTITHSLNLPLSAGFTIGVMSSAGDLISVRAVAVDGNTITLTSDFDVANVSMFMLANLTAMDGSGSTPEGLGRAAEGITIPDNVLIAQDGGYLVSQDGLYIQLNGDQTGGGD